MVAQYVDPEVSRSKFDREIAEYRELEEEYRTRGWLLLSAEFPHVLIALASPKLRPPAIVTGVAFDYTNYDAQPPSVRLVNPFTGEPYAHKDLPTQLLQPVQGDPVPGMPNGARLVLQQPLMQAHAPDDIPFLCLAGVREYHEHPGHTGDSWELHRPSGAGRLIRLLDVIHRYGVQPISGYSVQLQPVVGFEVTQVMP